MEAGWKYCVPPNQDTVVSIMSAVRLWESSRTLFMTREGSDIRSLVLASSVCGRLMARPAMTS